jgi:hypothetical protein
MLRSLATRLSANTAVHLGLIMLKPGWYNPLLISACVWFAIVLVGGGEVRSDRSE